MPLPAFQNFDNLLGTLGRGSATVQGVTYTINDTTTDIIVDSNHRLAFNSAAGTHVVSYKTADGAEFAPKDSNTPSLGSFAIYSNGTYTIELLRDGVVVSGSSVNSTQPARYDVTQLGGQSSNIDELRFTYTGTSLIIDDLTFSAPVPTPNAAPSFSNLSGDTVTYLEGAAPVRLDQNGDALVTDTDSANFAGGSLTASVGFSISTDQLSLDLTNTGVTLSAGATAGSVVSVRGSAVGTIRSGATGVNGQTLAIDFTSGATPAAAQTLVRTLAYASSDTIAPGAGTLSVNMTLTDGAGGTAVATTTLVVVEVNDAPTLTAQGLNPVFTEGGSGVDLFSNVAASVVDTNGQRISQLTLRVAGAVDGDAEILRVDGVDVQLGHAATYTGAAAAASIAVAKSGTDVTLTITKIGSNLTTSQVQSLIDSLSYRSVSSTPTETNRTITLTSIRDSGGTANGGVDTTVVNISSVVGVQATPDVAPVAAADRIFVSRGSTAVLPSAALIGNDSASYGRSPSLAAVGSASQGVVSFDAAAQTVTYAAPALTSSGDGSFSYFISDGVTLAQGVAIVTLLTPTDGADILNAPTLAGQYSFVEGGGGADLITGGSGVDILSGGLGADTLSGGNDNDVLYGNQDNDVLYGNQGADTLYGGQGADSLYGGQGDDSMFGNAGDDLLEGGAGINLIDGGDGIDTAAYAFAASGVTVSLLLQGGLQSTGISSDALVGIENLTGSTFADTLTGDAGANLLQGGAGADTLSGGTGNDILFGGTENDLLYGNQDNDALYGGAGNDTLYGGQGDDFIIGGAGADTLFGNLGIDTFQYFSTSDSPVGGSDLIADFASGVDKIELRPIHTGGAADAFSLTFSNGVTYLNVDLGNDGSIEMQIVITGTVLASDVLWS